MNNDLISRAAVVQLFEGLRDMQANNNARAALEQAVRIVNKAPAVDAEPVRHGRWIKIAEGYQKCSACDEAAAIFSGNRNYCPNCGVPMDEEV